MSRIYAPDTPISKDGIHKVGYVPAKIALANTTNENASASSVIALTHDTTELEVSAVGQWIAGRWAANQAASVVTAVASPAYDFVVPSGESRRYVVPIQTFVGNSSSIQGVNRANGLYQNVAFKTLAGNGSVLLGEY